MGILKNRKFPIYVPKRMDSGLYKYLYSAQTRKRDSTQKAPMSFMKGVLIMSNNLSVEIEVVVLTSVKEQIQE